MHLGADPGLKHRLYCVWTFWHKTHSAASCLLGKPSWVVLTSILSAAKPTTVLWLRAVGRVLRQPGDQSGWREYLIVLFHKAKDLWVMA